MHHDAAILHLRTADPKLAVIIDRVGVCTFAPITDGTHFYHLLRAIVYQQLSGKAAATIFGRVLDLFEHRAPTPEALIAVPTERLRAAGLSGQKAAYVKDLAERIASGEVPVENIESLPDEEVSHALLRVKGVGVWTAQMFLMFRLGRLNVLPGLDLGVRKGLQVAYRMRSLPSPDDVHRIGKTWSPYASIATWYLWRCLETPEGRAAVAASAARERKANAARESAKPTAPRANKAKAQAKAQAKPMAKAKAKGKKSTRTRPTKTKARTQRRSATTPKRKGAKRR